MRSSIHIVKAITTGIFGLLTTAALAQEVIPDFYKEPGLSPNRSHLNQDFSEKIDPFSGVLNLSYTDLHIPGNGGFDLNIVRTYSTAESRVAPNNPAAYVSELGVGWTMHFGRVRKAGLEATGPCDNRDINVVQDNPVLETSDGGVQLLAYTGNLTPLMLSTQRWRVDCHDNGNGFVVSSPDGMRYDMTQKVAVSIAPGVINEWYTTKITDRNGNTATISYVSAASPEIKSVTTNDGRVVTFRYLDSGKLSHRIDSINGEGMTYDYNYTLIPNTTDKYYLTSVTRPDGRRWQYSYNGHSNTQAGNYLVSKVTYPLGGEINYSYGFVYFDSQANPSSRSTTVKTKTNSLGGTWQYAYDPGSVGNLDVTTIDSPAGRQIFRHVGPNYSSSGTVWMVGLLISRTFGDQRFETYTWNPQKIGSEDNSRPGAFVLKVDARAVYAPVLAKRVINQNGAVYETSYPTFDGYGNPERMVESGPNGGTRSTALGYYINSGKWIVQQLATEEFSGGSTIRTFDSNGNMKSISVDGVQTSYTYDSQGNVSQATNPRSFTASYSSYKRGIARSESQPEGILIKREVSDAGNVISEINGDGYKTVFTYNGVNQITSITYPQGNAVTISYPGAQKVAKRGSLSQTTTYNGFGDVVGVNLGGISTTFQIDSLGRRTFQSNPNASSGTSYTFDILDRVRSMKNPDGSTAYVNYGAGTVVSTDENGRSTTRHFKSYGDPEKAHLIGISTPESGTDIAIDRNARDLIQSVSQGGVTRTNTYYSNYYLRSESHPEVGTIVYDRDAAGNMTSRTVGGRTTRFSYDGQNRLVLVTPPSGSTQKSFAYNKRSLMTSGNTGNTARNYGYSPNGTLATDSLTVGGWSTTLSYTYNANDHLHSVKNSRTGTLTSFTPDVLGRPTQVSGYVNSLSYWPSGQVGTINFSNGTSSSYGQNSRLWPSAFTAQKAGSATYVNSGYAYDNVGNLKTISDSVDGNFSRSMSYDGIDRLTSVSGPWGSGSITYSGSGNITRQSLGAFSLNYGYANNRLSNVSSSLSRSYSYDGYGNITGDSVNTYAYDDHSNLACVNCGDVSKRVDYNYDATGKRVSSASGGITTYEMHDHLGRLVYTDVSSSDLISSNENFYLGQQRVAQKQTQWYRYAITSLTANFSAATVGRSIRIIATISGPNPPGVVSFYNRGVLLGTAPVINGQAVLTVTFPAVGDALITASYADTYYSSPISASPSLALPITTKPPPLGIEPIIDLLLSTNPWATAS